MKKLLFKSILLLIFPFFIINCSSDDTEITSNAIINTTEANAQITFTSIKISGKVISNDGNTITSQGICWSKNPNPTISNEKITETTTTFTSVIQDLTVNTTYYFKVFATTIVGTAYSKELTLKTLPLGNTIWNFTITNHTGTEILAKVNFNEDQTTKYEESNCVDCYKAQGSWSVDGNKLTYIGENSDPATSTHVYTGTFTGLTMQGTYDHLIDPDGTWTAILQ